jgi:drug/metabolite transporter (DMT)-like permease
MLNPASTPTPDYQLANSALYAWGHSKPLRIAMNYYDFNSGFLFVGAAAAISILAAIVALYLWSVNRARQNVDQIADPATRAVIPWLSPLLLPTLIILVLGFVAGLWHAYEDRSWPKASSAIFTAWPAFVILVFWLKLHKKPRNASVEPQ